MAREDKEAVARVRTWERWATVAVASGFVFYLLLRNLNEYNYVAYGLVTAVFTGVALLALKGFKPVWVWALLPAMYLVALLITFLR